MEIDPGNQDAVVQLGDLDLAFYLLDPPGGRVFLADLKEITDRISKRDPRSFDGLRFSGNIALALNDTSAAILKFQQANLVKPDQPDLTLTLVQTLFAARRDEEAESLASAQIDRQKTFAPLYDALYAHYMRGNRPELAEQILQRKIANNPTRAAGLIQLAFHYFLLHRAADMRAAIDRLTADPKSISRGAAGSWGLLCTGARLSLPRSCNMQEGERQFHESKTARVYRKKMAEVLATEGCARSSGRRSSRDCSRTIQKIRRRWRYTPRCCWRRAIHGQAKAAIAELQPLIAKNASQCHAAFQSGTGYMAPDPDQQKAREQLEAALRLDPASCAREAGLGGAGAGARRTRVRRFKPRARSSAKTQPTWRPG